MFQRRQTKYVDLLGWLGRELQSAGEQGIGEGVGRYCRRREVKMSQSGERGCAVAMFTRKRAAAYADCRTAHASVRREPRIWALGRRMLLGLIVVDAAPSIRPPRVHDWRGRNITSKQNTIEDKCIQTNCTARFLRTKHVADSHELGIEHPPPCLVPARAGGVSAGSLLCRFQRHSRHCMTCTIPLSLIACLQPC